MADGTKFEDLDGTIDVPEPNTDTITLVDDDKAKTTDDELITIPDDDGTIDVQFDDDGQLADAAPVRPEEKDADETDADADDDDDTVEADAYGDETAQADEEDDDQKYGKRVKRRIARANRATSREKNRADSEANRAAQLEADNAKLRDSLTVHQHSLAEEAMANTDAQIQQAEALLTRAIDDGATEDHIKHTTTLAALQARKAKIQDIREQLDPIPEGYQADPGGDDPKPRPAPRAAAAPAPNQLATDWQNHNTWLADPKFTAHRAATMEVDRQMVAEGFDPRTREYFTELNNRVLAVFPNLAVANLSGAPAKRPAARQRGGTAQKPSPVAATNDGGSGNRPSAGGAGRVRLTTSDLANMKQYGLDPSDKDHLARYAREVYASRSK